MCLLCHRRCLLLPAALQPASQPLPPCRRPQTPTMTVPLLPGCDAAAATLLTSRMRRLKLAECLKGIKIWERPAIAVTHLATGERWAKGFDLSLRFHELRQYPKVGV